jgi:hypothetical protein
MMPRGVRFALLYFLMTAAFVAGLWLVLWAGADLRAPADISGRWSVVREENGTFEIRQSGQFVRLRMVDGEEVRLRSAGTPADPAVLAELAGDGIQMTLRALAPRQGRATHVLEARGALEGIWWIRREPRI